MKGADGDEGKHRMHEGENKMRRENSMITVKRRHKSEGGNYRSRRKKVQQVLKGNIGCMRVKMKCEGEKMKDYQGK